MSELKSEPIGANGMLYVMKRVGKIFSEGSLGNKSGGSEGTRALPPSQPSPAVCDTKWAIGTTDIIKEQCRICSGKGFIWGGIGKERECTHCEQRGYYEYRFPREIVKLANKLANQTPLVIARTLAGLEMGMKP